MCHNGVKVAVDWQVIGKWIWIQQGRQMRNWGQFWVYKNKNAWIIISCVYPLINYHPTSQTEKTRIKLAVARRRNIYCSQRPFHTQLWLVCLKFERALKFKPVLWVVSHVTKTSLVVGNASACVIGNSLEAGRGLSPLLPFCLVVKDLC